MTRDEKNRMESFDERKAKPSKSRHQEGGLHVWDGLSILLLVGAVMVAVVALMVVLNPYTTLNPYPPPTIVPTLFVPTTTPTQMSLPPTWTPTPTSTATPTLTPVPPTETPTPTITETGVVLTPSETSTRSPYPWGVRGEPSFISADAFHSGEGCKLWVGGQTFSLNKEPQTGIIVKLGGTLSGKTVDALPVLTGTFTQYGPASFEFLLADEAINSDSTLWLQLLDQNNLPLSARYYFQTFADCQKNLILINFIQLR